MAGTRARSEVVDEHRLLYRVERAADVDSADGTSEERRAALLHELAYCIDVVDPEAELEAGPGVAACDQGRLDLLLSGGHVQEVEEQATEFDADGGLVLEDDADGEDVAVELLGRLEVL